MTSLKGQVFFSLEKIDSQDTALFKQDLLFLRGAQKLLFVYHSGLSSEEFFISFSREMSSLGIRVSWCGEATGTGWPALSLRHRDGTIECHDFPPGMGIAVSQIVRAYCFLHFAKEVDESLEELEDNLRYNEYEKAGESPEVLPEKLLEHCVLFLKELPLLEQGYFSYTINGFSHLVRKIELNGLDPDPVFLMDRMKGRPFWRGLSAQIEELPAMGFSDGQVVGVSVRNILPSYFQGFVNFEREIVGIDFEVLRLKRELLEIGLSSAGKLFQRQKRVRLLGLFYRIAEALAFYRDFGSEIGDIIDQCKSNLGLRDLMFVFHPVEYPGQLFGTGLPLQRLAECISWDKIKLSTQSLSSIIADYTPFREEEKQLLKRLYYFPLVLRRQVQGIAVFSVSLGKLSLDTEESEMIRLLLMLLTQNILFHFQARKIQELKRQASMGDMAATIAHEIRNPLGGISLLATFLENRLKGTDEKKMAGDIRAAVENVENLITDFLAFSRIDHLTAGRHQLKELLEEVVGLLKLKIDESGIQIDVHFNELPAISVDREKVKQVVVNMLLNAIQATPQGGRIVIRTGVRDSLQFFSVWNSGSSIEEKDMSRIFEPFFTTRAKGSGLGLAISRKIVEGHQGRIEAENRDEGVEFRVLLPQDMENAEP
ncbi:MAG: ATP-binding protein [Candidatus Wallbacteria bacterium]|nr:ATP-binding protein [Candidatus Wallbacteria bacterium]